MENREKQVKLFLLRAGIKCDQVGFTFLKEIILRCADDQSLLKNFKALCASVGQKLGEDNPVRIEANMNNAIKNAFKNKRLEGLNKLFGAAVVNGTRKPTCLEIIRLGIEYINLELYKDFVWEEEPQSL